MLLRSKKKRNLQIITADARNIDTILLFLLPFAWAVKSLFFSAARPEPIRLDSTLSNLPFIVCALYRSRILWKEKPEKGENVFGSASAEKSVMWFAVIFLSDSRSFVDEVESEESFMLLSFLCALRPPLALQPNSSPWNARSTNSKAKSVLFCLLNRS